MAAVDTNNCRSEQSVQAVGQGVGFERTRRITGYLVGTLDRFNNAKRSEVRDRVLHGTISDRAAAVLSCWFTMEDFTA